jgi:hypothetical protein
LKVEPIEAPIHRVAEIETVITSLVFLSAA